MLRRSPRRSAATVVECALVMPVLLLLVFGLIVGGLGVFRYQEVTSLAREGARYASVHGQKYELNTGKKASTSADVYNNAIAPRIASLDPANVTYTVTWDPDDHQGSFVTVTVNYQWIPEAYLGGVTLSSSSTMQISY
jgi:Flp pilus assembly protein TadG